MTRRDAVLSLTAFAVAPLVGCRPGTPSIAFDADSCEACRMTISDRRFGAAARTEAGRIVRFDSIECLASWLNGASTPPQAVWVVDAMVPATLIALDDAVIHQASIATPMSGESRRSEKGEARSEGFIAVARTHASTPWDGPAVSLDTVRAVVSRGWVGAGSGR